MRINNRSSVWRYKEQSQWGNVSYHVIQYGAKWGQCQWAARKPCLISLPLMLFPGAPRGHGGKVKQLSSAVLLVNYFISRLMALYPFLSHNTEEIVLDYNWSPGIGGKAVFDTTDREWEDYARRRVNLTPNSMSNTEKKLQMWNSPWRSPSCAFPMKRFIPEGLNV